MKRVAAISLEYLQHSISFFLQQLLTQEQLTWFTIQLKPIWTVSKRPKTNARCISVTSKQQTYQTHIKRLSHACETHINAQIQPKELRSSYALPPLSRWSSATLPSVSDMWRALQWDTATLYVGQLVPSKPFDTEKQFGIKSGLRTIWSCWKEKKCKAYDN